MNFILYFILGLLILFWLIRRLLPIFLKKKFKQYQDNIDSHSETSKGKNIKIKFPKGYKKNKVDVSDIEDIKYKENKK
ncbi:MAG TPA: hypothetical protein PKJ07_00265 [Bacteroidales bacterium]|jgi:hypothetical protein|nr:hypothetical protein [Bacteroidales bacterium]HOB26567.1 hypothetical protein [Bacteroidales bacterium]HOK21449.1 hypothetical protein [Bacteroidales bacterium]HOL75027.1 hypothetical protein [Bacteroidales bacterium]HPU46362.1 hypothetical protein [Bacteroidales bacterium]